MGQMKKLYELAGDGTDQSAMYFMRRTSELTLACTQVLELMRKAEFLLNDWLVDNTDQVFEEQPDIDTARGYLNEAIELLEKPHDAEGASIQDRRPHEDGDDPRSGADA